MPPVPAPLAIPRVLAAVRAVLLGDAALIARLATAPATAGGGPGIYNETLVPPDARTDYLTIGPFTERSDSTMGTGRKWGSELTMQVKLVTMSKNISATLGTVDRVVALLHGVPLTVADYASGICLLDVVVDAYSELVAGQQMLHYPALFRVLVHQPT